MMARRPGLLRRHRRTPGVIELASEASGSYRDVEHVEAFRCRGRAKLTAVSGSCKLVPTKSAP